MTDSNTQQLLDSWRRQLEEGAQAWARMVTQSAPPDADPAALWRPLLDQGFQHWARVFAQTPVAPDLMAQWKQFLDQSIDAWSRALGQAMNTEGFAQMLGRTLDQTLLAQGPLKKAAEQQIEAAQQALNLPSRSQLTGVAKQIVSLEERVERVEEGVTAIVRRLDQVARMLKDRPAAAREKKEPQ
ncbi:MAG TPA: hypothetical protein VGL09_12860 [Methylomirabilota bacterium]